MLRKPRPRVVTSAIVAILVVTAAVLVAMGRTPWCRCGVIKFWHGVVNSSENSQHFVDPYSFTHILHGLGFYLLLRFVARGSSSGARCVAAVAMESVWEIIENTNGIIERYRATTMSLDYFGDSVVNSIGDILAATVGFWLASRLPAWVSILAVLVIEVALALWIRDGLVLNILMLIYPLETLKHWQLGL